MYLISVQGDCAGKADIIIAVPGSVNIPGEEFFPFETFLHMLVDYFVLDENNVNIGFVLYGNEPTILSHPQPFKDQAKTNTRATLLTQRENYMNILGSPPNVARALNLMRAMFQNPSGYPMERPRRGVKKIGVIFTWGAQPIEAFDDVVRASDDLRMDGVTMYAVGRSPIGPEFARLATDECKLFSMGNFQEGLPSVLPYLGSSICTREYLPVLSFSPNKGR